jgi:hypothetical protein
VNQIVMETREGEVVVDCRLSEGEADQFRSLRPKIRPIVQMLTDLGREHLLEGCPHEHQPGCPVCEAYSLLTGVEEALGDFARMVDLLLEKGPVPR